MGQFWLLEYVQPPSSAYLRVRLLPFPQQPKGLPPSAGSFLMLLLRGLLFLECSSIAGDSECSAKVGSGGIGHVSKTARNITARPLSDKVSQLLRMPGN